MPSLAGRILVRARMLSSVRWMTRLISCIRGSSAPTRADGRGSWPRRKTHSALLVVRPTTCIRPASWASCSPAARTMAISPGSRRILVAYARNSSDLRSGLFFVFGACRTSGFGSLASLGGAGMGAGEVPAPKLRTSPRLSSAAKGVWPHSQGVASTPVQTTRRPLRPSRTDHAAKLSATTKGSLRHSYRPASPTISANSSARSNSSPGFRSEHLSWYRSQSRRERSNPSKSL